MAGKVQGHTDAVLGLIRGTAFTTLTSEYLAILKTNPSDDAMTGAVETNYTNYVRLTMGTIASIWGSISGSGVRSMTNANVLNFATAGATGDTVNGFVICKGTGTFSTDGLYWNALTGGAKVINANDPVSVAVGAITVTED